MNRHDPRHDRNRNPNSPALLDPVQENVDVVKHLSNNEGCARVHLFLQVLEQQVRVWLVVASLGVARNSNVKVVSVFLTNVLDEILCVAEAAVDGFPLFLFSGRVAAELGESGWYSR